MYLKIIIQLKINIKIKMLKKKKKMIFVDEYILYMTKKNVSFLYKYFNVLKIISKLTG